jgi:Tol biopolymer transport system component
VAYGAFGSGRSSSDLWVTDLGTGATSRVTDDDGDSNDPQWSADGTTVAYSAGAPSGKDVVTRRVGKQESRVVAAREGTQFPSDWLRDGSALLVTDGEGTHDVIVQPTDGGPARAFAATPADERTARSSPDGRWVAYTSDESGRPEVYVAAYAQPDRKMMVSEGGGMDPVWRGDGRELYYWTDGALTAARLEPGRRENPPSVTSRSILFRAPYQSGLNTMYDVSPDGTRFVIVLAPKD